MRAKKPTVLFWLLVVVACIYSASCGSPDEQGGSSGGSGPAGSGEAVEVGGAEAIVWGEGERGAVLAHGAVYDAASWEDQAQRIAKNGAVALAVEDTSAQSVAEADRYLKDERGVRDVTLVGASAGTGGVLGAAEGNPGLADGVILLSGTGDVSGLGEYPKLIVASKGEGLAPEVRRMVEEAPGGRNKALILPGDAHAQAIFETDQGERLVRAILRLLRESG